MRIISWNVNGLRACTKKGFLDWFHQSGADIVGLQEVRARLDQLDPAVAQPTDWHLDLSHIECFRPGKPVPTHRFTDPFTDENSQPVDFKPSKS